MSLISANVAAQEMKPIFEIGTEVHEETYKETVNGGPFMQEKAIMYGVTGTVGMQLKQHALKFTGRYAQGKGDYTGSLQGGTYGSVRSDGQDRHTYELLGTYEYTTSLFTPSIGLGYRNLVDRLDQGGDGGYKRESEYTFLALGLESKFDFGGSKLSVTPKLVYNYLLQGMQHSHSQPPLGSVSIENRQKNGDGFVLSAAFAYTLQDKSVVKLTPFYRYWSIDDSEVSAGILEPKNTTKEVGINLTYQF